MQHFWNPQKKKRERQRYRVDVVLYQRIVREYKRNGEGVSRGETVQLSMNILWVARLAATLKANQEKQNTAFK